MPSSSNAKSYTGRLAPSPTGLLHLGHARTFWTAFERARVADGKLWLRDEDLDPQRSLPDFSAAMREDLQWLGITWNEEAKQSERLALYRNAMQQLLVGGHVYPCHCSRRDLQRATQAPHEDDDEPIYRGTCRSISATPPQTEIQPNTNYRFRILDDEITRFTDLDAGPQIFRAGCDDNASFGDFLVWRKDGLPSYQLACVVDDANMSITEVVRGRDLLKSTARQLLLQRALGLPTPKYFHCDLMRDESGVRLAKYFHCDLMRDESGVRLAKRHDALSLRSMREAGLSPAQVRARFLDR